MVMFFPDHLGGRSFGIKRNTVFNRDAGNLAHDRQNLALVVPKRSSG
jgi:hypothetical protein